VPPPEPLSTDAAWLARVQALAPPHAQTLAGLAAYLG